MPMKEQQRSVYRTARGKEIDMGKIVNQNELTIAVGNAKVNARGDKIGPDGKIIQRREEIQKESGDQIVPNQISIRSSPVAPVPQPTIIPVKNVKDMDPEGNE
jgi:hypothetical protein